MLQLKMTNAGMIVFLIIFVKKDNVGFWRSWRSLNAFVPVTYGKRGNAMLPEFTDFYKKKCLKLMHMPTVSIRLN